MPHPSIKCGYAFKRAKYGGNDSVDEWLHCKDVEWKIDFSTAKDCFRLLLSDQLTLCSNPIAKRRGALEIVYPPGVLLAFLAFAQAEIYLFAFIKHNWLDEQSGESDRWMELSSSREITSWPI